MVAALTTMALLATACGAGMHGAKEVAIESSVVGTPGSDGRSGSGGWGADRVEAERLHVDTLLAAAWAGQRFANVYDVPAGVRGGAGSGVSAAVPATAMPVAGGASPTVVPGGAGGDRWLALLAQYGWPVGEAERVMQCESSGNPLAVNGSSVGLFQVNLAAHPQYTYAEMIDPVQNIAAAYAIWKDNAGWGPWSCKP